MCEQHNTYKFAQQNWEMTDSSWTVKCTPKITDMIYKLYDTMFAVTLKATVVSENRQHIKDINFVA